MKKNSRSFGCLVVVVSFFVAIAVAISKLNNDRVKGDLKNKIVKKIKIRK